MAGSIPSEYRRPDSPEWAKVGVWKSPGESVRFTWENQSEFDTDANEVFKGGHADILMPEYVLGCLLFRDTNSLFLLDEPETHFNPDWRANFISRLRESLRGPEGVSQEMLITTHSPFLISDSTPDKVLLFDRDPDDGKVRITHPNYNTLGASINKITMSNRMQSRS